ncbi:MAG: peptidoglycan editing factor PgeF [Marinilabiliaceae bacterium]|nr:peptidoglycan editing factor PgeF [Marinilabiliaceae bacterium]
MFCWKFGKGISALLTDRHGGISKPPYNSNNLATHVGDNMQAVMENRNRLANELGINTDDFVFMNQIHSNRVVCVDDNLGGVCDCDALITNTKMKVLMVMVADCVPILFADEDCGAIAVAHAGWRGINKKIVSCVIDSLNGFYGCEPKNIKVWLGPSIKSCCYQVGEDVAFALHNSHGVKLEIGENEKFLIDMHEVIKFELFKKGINIDNIFSDNDCVACNSSHYFSYRRENGVTGRFAAGIWLTDK